MMMKTMEINFPVFVNAFSDEGKRDEIKGAVIGVLAVCISTYNFSLDRLEAVTVVDQYDKALAEFDHGFSGQPPLGRTTGASEGVGQTPVVLRNGSLRCHMFLASSITVPLLAPENPYYRYAAYTITHEAAHAHDLGVRAQTLESQIISPTPVPNEPGILSQMAHLCWDEYAACRLSGASYPDMVGPIEENLSIALKAFPTAADQMRTVFAQSDHLQSAYHAAYNSAVEACYPVLKHLSYLAGHLVGTGQALELSAPTAKRLLEETGFMFVFQELTAVCGEMWTSYGSWPDLDVFVELKKVVGEAILLAGIEFFHLPDGKLKFRVVP
jgi:hypothetical protein